MAADLLGGEGEGKERVFEEGGAEFARRRWLETEAVADLLEGEGNSKERVLKDGVPDSLACGGRRWRQWRICSEAWARVKGFSKR